MSDLSKVKVGDKVVLSVGYGGRQKCCMEVTRLTPTQIVCGTSRYRKDNGQMVGADHYYTNKILRVATEEDQEEFARQRLAERIGNTDRSDWYKLPRPQLQQIRTWLEEAKGQS